ncbi:hypothetical protein EYZ11_009420 [Aspergillus tanneri]|uniref:N-acetyltransferase domain-containing protein n=1 Tax=Aspergillus tanneri TaxID=1220188 RepID=A0A4S3J7X5_9EURO|nr:uncharacterized protein ATNIH1004_000018 [Aspergillus tanneri]KAA8651140.1 hypothetical protein ATNIH1004_000018 [Aspergillus tanneri]THC91106.1 hypothetical protein EYZ11_009420 [Aspergillus tanneri]
MLPILSTDRLELVAVTDEHLPFEIEMDTNPEVMRYIIGRPRTEDEVIKSHEKRLSLVTESPGRGFWVGLLDNTPIGLWMLLPSQGLEQSREAELGYRLLPQFWHQGFASEGARALLNHCFAGLGLDRVYGKAMVAHTATRAILIKMGMKYIRDYSEEIEGSDQEVVEYAITRDEWESQHK